MFKYHSPSLQGVTKTRSIPALSLCHQVPLFSDRFWWAHPGWCSSLGQWSLYVYNFNFHHYFFTVLMNNRSFIEPCARNCNISAEGAKWYTSWKASHWRSQKKPHTYFHRESTYLLGAMGRGRMKDASPDNWTGQRCAAPWEASCSIPGGRTASLCVHCPPSTRSHSPPLLWVLQDTELSLAVYLPCLALGYLPATTLWSGLCTPTCTGWGTERGR